ncbi:hypothetical protein U5817_17185 [Aromatoleum evansii]|uniref:Uracil-DNA glycosylase-like domain-containing protein n=1 Tax=Aromatoleum evansii TaxID=59406 RepID=A0ABZ1AGD5_AROEV|nr:hypothetical protein U5817_17185 [Aromatoleum evansii]
MSSLSTASQMSLDLRDAYKKTLLSHDLTAMSAKRTEYSGLFLPAAQPEFLHASFKVMLVGQETKGGFGKLEGFLNARDEGRVDEYLQKRYALYGGYREKKPGKSRFGQFLRMCERELNLPSRAVHWSNLFACDFKRKTPRHRPTSELSELLRLSGELLSLQIEHLKPDAILFTTGPQYDRFLREIVGKLGGVEASHRVVPRKLWTFSVRGIPCFRTTHPRYGSDNSHRGDALSRIRNLQRQAAVA